MKIALASPPALRPLHAYEVLESSPRLPTQVFASLQLSDEQEKPREAKQHILGWAPALWGSGMQGPTPTTALPTHGAAG